MLTLPLEMSVGEDFYLPIQYQIEICNNFSPIDISGYTVQMQIGLRPFSEGFDYISPIIDILSPDNITIDGPNGKIEIRIPRAIVTPYMFGEWSYAVKVTNSVGLVERLFGGHFNIKGWC